MRKKRKHGVADVQKDPCISTHCAQSQPSYRAQRGMSRTGLRLATATPALAARARQKLDVMLEALATG
jgi:hypothetical protein